MTLRHFLLLSLLVSGVAFQTASAAPRLQVEAGWDFDSNVSLSQEDTDIADDSIFSVRGSVTETLHRGPSWAVRARGGIGYRHFFSIEDLRRVELFSDIRARYQPGRQFTSPWLDLSLGAQGLLHQDSEIRDGGIFSARVGAGRRITDRLLLRGGYRYSVRLARTDDVYDTELGSVDLDIDFTVNRNITFFTRGGFQHGEVVSNASPSSLPNAPSVYGPGPVGLGIGNVFNEISQDPDDAFGAGRFAYQVDSTAAIAAAGFSIGLPYRLALDISADYVKVDAAGPVEYSAYRAGFALFRRF